MEAFFHQDARVSQWLDQAVEKLFTVCLLSGPDADAEFRRGRQAVEKVAATLAELAVPLQALDDGVKQLIEQRLPDSRVTKNFPQFYHVMNRMIKEGVAGLANVDTDFHAAVTAPASDENSHKAELFMFPVAAPSEETGSWKLDKGPVNTIYPDLDLEEAIAVSVLTSSMPSTGSVKVLGPDLSVHTIPVPVHTNRSDQPQGFLIDSPVASNELAGVQSEVAKLTEAIRQEPETNVIIRDQRQTVEEIIPSAEEDRRIISSTTRASRLGRPAIGQKRGKAHPEKPGDAEIAENTTGGRHSIGTRAARTEQVPEGAEMLSFVLRQLYPGSYVRWNYRLREHDFLAQVDNILIQIGQPDQMQALTDKMRQQGWHLVILPAEDIRFPRRIERAIRQLVRLKL